MYITVVQVKVFSSLHKKAGLLKVRDRRRINLLGTIQDKDNLRSNLLNLYELPRAKNTKYERSFIVNAIKLWNNMKEEFKSIGDTKEFKCRVKRERYCHFPHIRDFV